MTTRDKGCTEMERESGYYWVRWYSRKLIAEWAAALGPGRWLIDGVEYAESGEIEVLYGPIPGPEELQRMEHARNNHALCVMEAREKA